VRGGSPKKKHTHTHTQRRQTAGQRLSTHVRVRGSCYYCVLLLLCSLTTGTVIGSQHTSEFVGAVTTVLSYYCVLSLQGRSTALNQRKGQNDDADWHVTVISDGYNSGRTYHFRSVSESRTESTEMVQSCKATAEKAR